MMQYCHYHPLLPATQECADCRTSTCDACVKHDYAHDKVNCIVCQKPMLSLGSAFSAQPFWRRLDKSFRYPLNSQAFIIIAGLAILSSVVSFLPFAFILILAVNGAFFKYGFACLENSAWGNFTPVDASEAFEGGLSLMLQLIAIILGLSLMVITVAYIFGATAAVLTGTILLMGFPAIIINFSLTKSVFDALNPANMLRLIATIGLPYGLLLAFIFIMVGSVGVVAQLLANAPSFASVILGSIVSNYYTLVILHIMGYMIFQYQNKLGFTASENYGEETEELDELSAIKTEIQVWVKEGDADKVLELYNIALEKFPGDTDLYNKCYRFLIETRNIKRLKPFANLYFEHLADNKNHSRMRQVWKEIQGFDGSFIPQSARHRHLIAKASFDKDDFASSVKLLNGLHKSDPDYPKLGDAYEIFANALECLPKYKAQVAPARKLAAALKEKQAKNTPVKDKAGTGEKLKLEPISSEPPNAEASTASTTPTTSGDLPPIDFPGFDGKY